jgi:predicted metal-dependent enzyme (double-stranded beta helix superfamily)
VRAGTRSRVQSRVSQWVWIQPTLTACRSVEDYFCSSHVSEVTAMFDVQRLVEQCQGALKETDPRGAIREILERTVSQPSDVLTGLGEPDKATVQKIHVADDLTILNVIWGPHMVLMPHNHKMSAIIGVYTGAEDNIFWRRTGDQLGLIRPAGARALRTKDVEVLGPDAIHSVTNPIPRLTGAIHIYLGPFMTAHRSEWNPETLIEGIYDIEKNLRLFDEANARLSIR